MKTVLFVFHDSKPRSGATASMLDIIDNLLIKEDIKLLALIPKTNDGLRDLLEKKNIESIESRIYGGRHPLTERNLEALTYRFKGLLKSLVTYFSVLSILTKVNTLKVDVIYSNSSDNYAGYFLSKLLRIKHIWHVREFGIEDQNCKHAIGEKKFHKWLNSSEKVIVISKALKGKLAKHVDAQKLCLVYDDVKFPSVELTESKNYGPLLKLLIVGTISEGKGQKFVIDVVNLLNSTGVHCTLSIAGDIDSSYAKYLIDYVRKNNISNISFLGFREDIDSLRGSYDIGIVASRAEAFGRVTIEGMSAGLVMVASNAGANPELISDRENGFLYEENNTESLSNVISYISKHKDTLNDIRDNAFQFSKRFDSGVSSQNIFNIIKNL
ncbi:glycosyltransferase family 4 protein [Vibrio sp. 10N.222.52.C3]|uniref:glycosyltransferase family 4 protein n=1 Tax=Vibrio sp. 10N.222.52.C3 TaxID=3229631 RepID=UPI0035544BD2